ncbi:hypothetical protein MKS88_002617 [Plasmodium brasilianum]|uniref:Uncharacterized protein n=1 Tax=Plasmodium brasilianum TaxID=5824 RepID=A0ACB9YC55_PLABR|nr:hypothetical protein MKS88_002617 [Plasmodium brasilianum]
MEELSEENLNKILAGSPSGSIYDKFNRNYNGDQNNTFCNVFNTEKDNYPTGSYELCNQIARNAENLSVMIDKGGYKYCAHYTYWIYYKIKKILESSQNSKSENLIKFLEVKSKIYNQYRLYNCLSPIQGNTIEELNKKVDEKYLFDYFQNYDSIKTYDICDKITFSEYKKYLNVIKKLYIEHKNDKKCCADSFWGNCDYFKCNTEFDPNTLLHSLNSNGNEKCDILKKLEKTTKSGYPMDSGVSQIDISSSFYYSRCTDIIGDSPSIKTPEGGKQKCNMFAVSPKAIYSRTSPYYDTFYRVQHATVRNGTPGDSHSESETPNSTEYLPKQHNSSPPDSSRSPHGHLNGLMEESTKSHAGNNHLLSPSKSSTRQEAEITGKQTNCSEPGYLKDSSGICREPSVRHTGTIGLKLDTYQPGKTKAIITLYNIPISVLLDKKSNIFNNNILRFTPFGRRFHKKVPKKRRIDDYYYDDPHMRHFIIRAPKSDKRKVGSRRLRFSYYSRKNKDKHKYSNIKGKKIAR